MTHYEHKSFKRNMLKQEIKYPCNQCPSNFTRKGNLKTHMKSVHEGVKHKCNLCQYKATQKGNLKRHMKSVHEGISVINANTNPHIK